MIPAEAVEAAVGVLIYHQRRDVASCMCGWSELGQSHAMHQAKLALEAAAPHMLHGLAASLGDATAEIMDLRAQLRGGVS